MWKANYSKNVWAPYRCQFQFSFMVESEGVLAQERLQLSVGYTCLAGNRFDPCICIQEVYRRVSLVIQHLINQRIVIIISDF